VLSPGIALVGDFHLGAKHEHAEPLRHRLGEIARDLQ
jgi:hypothetical protein